MSSMQLDKLVRIVNESEPQLSKEMETRVPVSAPENTRLFHEECDFATKSLAKLLKQHDIKTKRWVGFPFDIDDSDISRETRDIRHYILRVQGDRDTSFCTIDPTYGQFLKYAGLPVTRSDAVGYLPLRSIAVIPEGCEPEFGARFADFAQNQTERYQCVNEYVTSGLRLSWGALSSIWDPNLYRLDS